MFSEAKNLTNTAAHPLPSETEDRDKVENDKGESATSVSSDFAIRIKNVSKCYQIYDAPRDRLKQFIFPRLQRLLRRKPKQYYREFWALKDVSFEVKKGETMGVIGRNGSGKSTLLQLVCGTLAPTTGEIQINGRVAALLELGAGFNPEFTGRENARMNMSILGLNQASVELRLDEVIRFAEIDDFIEQPVRTYSSGMYIRLAFSVAIHVDPDILIIDEALAVGDFAFQFKCLKRLKELSQAGVSILFVTHDILQVQKICTQALYLKKGKPIYFGDTKIASDQYFSENSIDEAGGNKTPLAKSSAKHELSAVINQGLYADFGDHVAPYRSGSRQQGEILYVTLNGTFKEEPVINFGETIEIEVILRLNSTFLNPAIAFYVIDEAGQFIVGSNSQYEGITFQVGEMTETSRLIIAFENRLRGGRYGIQIYLVEFARGLSTKYVDYIDLAARFIAANPPTGERWAWYTPPFSVSLETY